MDGCVAIIPARAGSKGLPGKNLALVDGRTLVEWAIRAALDTPAITRIAVSSDDPRVLDVARMAGADAIVRPAELASDGASMESVIRHALEDLGDRGEMPDAFVLLQPTSPLRDPLKLASAIRAFVEAGESGSVYGVLPVEHHPHKMLRIEGGVLTPLTRIEDLSAPRQELPHVVRQSGSIYVVSARRFLREGTLFLEPVIGVEVDACEGIDIDDATDLERVRAIRSEGR